MQQVILAEDSFDPTTWETFEVEDICAFLVERFGDRFPDTARIYHKEVNLLCDVTPADEEGIERLSTLEGPVFVIVYPGDPVTAIIAVVAVVAIAATVFLLSVIPNAAARNNQTTSPNNELSNRTNRPRVNGRIPDIMGEVTSTPDLLAVPYKVFKDHREVEVSFLCIGRGEYEIGTIYDDTTPVSEIEGMQVEVYAPFTSPVGGDSPQVSIGDPITDEVANITTSTAVNGQTLQAPNYKTLQGTDNIRIESSTKLKVRDTSVAKWPSFFDVGDTVVISGPNVDAKNFNGTYTVAAVDDDFLTLDNPGAINAAWNAVGLPSSWYGPMVRADVVRSVGPIFVNIPTGAKLIANLLALSGMYKNDGSSQVATEVEVQFEVTPVDGAGVPTGATETFFGTVQGSNSTVGTRALTVEMYPSFSGRAKIEVERITPIDYGYNGTVVDEVKWRDLYIAQPVSEEDFGNITTVLAVTYATEGALSLKDRKLNMLVTRKVASHIEGLTFGPLVASKNAADIISHVCLDPFIGNRSADEVDFDSIYATVQEIEDYFGTAEAAQFCYTFDKDNVSFEETMAAIASAVFSTAYRRGRVIRLSFEKATEDSTLLFNHRNKLPGSEVRTVRFGYQDDIDGVEYTYVDPEDDAVVTKYLPADQSAINPKKVESIGVRSHIQAHFQINRIWNKFRFQNTTTEFVGLQQAEMLVRQDRILVADNTRSDTMDGDVLGQNLLEIMLSQPVEIDGPLDHVIFLQHTDGSTQAIDIVSIEPVAEDKTTRIVLAEPPSMPLAFGLRVNTGYVIVSNDAPRSSAFLVAEREPQGNFTSTVTAVNYDNRYYQNDQDFVLDLIP